MSISTTQDNNYDVIIIGGGVAGLSASIYSARDSFRTLVLHGISESSTQFPGGALGLTNSIENYPGFAGGEGMDLIDIMRDQGETSGANMVEEKAVNISRNMDGTYLVTSNEDTVYHTKAIILAVGSVAKRLGIPGEAELYGRGVSSCATCDGFFFRGKEVVVVGGGDTAIEDALLLSNLASKVTLLVRSNKLKASGPEVKKLLEKENVEILWETKPESITQNDDRLTINHDKGSITVDGVFVAIGSTPSTGFLEDTTVQLDNEGYIILNQGYTQVPQNPGIFAAGDAADAVYRQAVVAAGRAVQAALDVRAYLGSNFS